VLDLDVTEAVESLLVGSVEHAEGIPKAKRRLRTEFVLEGHLEGRGGLARLGRGKGGGAGNKGGNDSELHLVFAPLKL
jgi:hypothetical protein